MARQAARQGKMIATARRGRRGASVSRPPDPARHSPLRLCRPSPSVRIFPNGRQAAHVTREAIVSEQKPRTTFSQPTPELPVADVERAQRHYRDALGFVIGWLEGDGELGAVSRDDVAIFLRRRSAPFEPAVHWVFAEDIDATHEELRASGARIVEPLETKPWGLRQFTVEDVDGNRFHFHRD